MRLGSRKGRGRREKKEAAKKGGSGESGHQPTRILGKPDQRPDRAGERKESGGGGEEGGGGEKLKEVEQENGEQQAAGAISRRMKS